MPDPGAPSGAVAEITFTAGTGPYQLNPIPPHALAAYFRFADVFADGASIPIEVDDTAQKEIIVSTFNSTANTLSRDPAAVLFSSAGPGTLIDWPERGQRTVRPLSGLPICDTPPTDGQVLAWDSLTMKWCPATIAIPDVPPGFAVCSTPPTIGQVLVWNGTEWCPADFCALVDACLNPPPPPCTVNWVRQTNAPGPFQWYATTISDDGTAMAAFEASNPAIVVTTDSGTTWIDVTPVGLTGNPFLIPLASDSTGQKLLVGPGGPRSGLYLSTNAGASWSTVTLTDSINGQGNEGGFSVAMSADGTKMIAGAGNFGLFGNPGPVHVWVSLNGGSTWVEQPALVSSGGSTTWNVFMARDGTAFVAINGTRAFVSLDGSSWTLMTNPFFPDQFHATAAITSNASVILVAHNLASDFIYKSTNQGTTWTQITTLGPTFFGGNANGSTLSISLDGQVIAAGTQDSDTPTTGPLYVSCDGGATWAANFTGSSPFGYWNSVFVTGDGGHFAIATQGPSNNFPYAGTLL